ncbi:MAG: flagellar export chaperone FliS [candidate division Zixibacteria bacterium]|nr:flagellar export chaperone FliS [candidate division Zixibacteria bacterium]
MNEKLQQYRKSETEKKTVTELIIMVYDGAIDNLKKASEFYNNDKMQDGYEAMEKAKRFVVHLYTTLDEEKGGEVAENLSKMYAYIIERMNFIQATKDIETIDESISLLSNIKEGWVGLAEQEKKGQLKNNNNLGAAIPKKGLSFSA